MSKLINPPTNDNTKSAPSESAFVHISDVSQEIIRDLRFQRDVKKIHSFGPRAVGELLAEIGAQFSIMTAIEQTASKYAEMTEEQIEAAHADDWLSPVLRSVEEEE